MAALDPAGSTPRVRVRRVDFALTECHTRIPFRFGSATLTWAPLFVARAEIETETGERVLGYSSDLLVPKWFEKDPAKTALDDALALGASARAAARAACAPQSEPESAFALWWRVYRERVAPRPATAPDRLVRGFGVALVERALLDATCRAAGLSFFDALHADLFGFEPGRVHPALAGARLSDALPRAPLASVRVRHTVGLVDPLRARDVPAHERVQDGLPQALEEDVRRYGLSCFKLKLSGQADEDRARLLEIARVLAETAGGPVQCTLDGNEQYADLAPLVALVGELARTRAGAALVDGLLYIEQPLPRALSFEPARTALLRELAAFAPVIVDEADHGIEAFPLALERGYRGISVKNCKGVFRALLNHLLCARAGGGAFLAAEDLTNLPVLALQQDLATVAALGLAHVERNGHHYFRGLDHLPPAEARAACAAHPDLYEEGEDGIFLALRGGALALRSLACRGFAYDVPIAFDEREPLARFEARAASGAKA